VLRLLDSAEPNSAAYNLLRSYLELLDDSEGEEGARPAVALAFRAKLALASGFAPELASCARCGEAQHLSAFSGAAGGVVCASCEGEGFPLSEEAHTFLVNSLGSPLAEAPDAGAPALRAAERAIAETLEHHAHVRLRAAA
jgi:DNA repair protein RecO (recombination protein O)